MKIIEFIQSFFKTGTSESSMRLIWILAGTVASVGILIIDIKFAKTLTKYSGIEIAAIITANAGFIGTILYGKIQQNKQEKPNENPQ